MGDYRKARSGSKKGRPLWGGGIGGARARAERERFAVSSVARVRGASPPPRRGGGEAPRLSLFGGRIPRGAVKEGGSNTPLFARGRRRPPPLGRARALSFRCECDQAVFDLRVASVGGTNSRPPGRTFSLRRPHRRQDPLQRGGVGGGGAPRCPGRARHLASCPPRATRRGVAFACGARASSALWCLRCGRRALGGEPRRRRP